MNRKQELNALIKECITRALIKLMNEKPFDDITVTELVERAGVSRVSFYRNFQSKKHVLEEYLKQIWYEWEKDYKKDITGEQNQFIESILRHFYKNKDFNLLLYKHGMSELIYEVVRWGAKIDESDSNIESYIKSMVAGTVFGLADEWLRRGMQETAEEIIVFLQGVNKNDK